MDRAEKSEVVTALNLVFKDTGAVVVAHYSGLTVTDMTALRARMREAGAGVRVAKNRLIKRALEGTEIGHIADLFTGPTVIAYSNDPVAAPKVAVEFAKANEKLVILGGAIGRTNLDPAGVKALAALPSLDELRAKLVGLLVSPARRIAQIVATPAGRIARVIGAHGRQSEAA
ncbi:MAG: 50S ribosomal protein L10 [Bauldia sp.]